MVFRPLNCDGFQPKLKRGKREDWSMKKHRQLKAEDLCTVCDVSELPCRTTEELEPLDGIIGQERALRAIQFGLGMRSFGYNLYVAGTPGTGKKTLIRSLVEEIARTEATPNDIFYIHNFVRPERPRAIHVPAGIANAFKTDMARLVDTLTEEVPKGFKGEDFEHRRNAVIQGFQAKRTALIGRVQEEARKLGLAVKASGQQLISIPVVNGHELTPEEFDNLDDQSRDQIKRGQEQLGETLQGIYHEIREAQQATQAALSDLDHQVAMLLTAPHVGVLMAQYRPYPAILSYLEEVQKDIVENITDFLEDGEEVEDSETQAGPNPYFEIDPLARYKVNVIVDNSRQKGAPVVTETNPNYRNLVGYSERETRMGTLHTDFSMIRAGSILAANHGYLILDLVDLLSTPLAWESLKRVLQDGEVTIQEPGDQYGVVGTIGFRPEPVKVELKVIVLGSTEHYNVLYSGDEDFQKLFKIKAEFDTVMKKNSAYLMEYARFVKTLSEKEGLRHFEREAVGTLVEFSSRMVSDKTRLTLRFSDVADVIRESDYWAGKGGRKYVSRADVERAIGEKIFRSNLFEARLQEMIDEGSILIQTTGRAVGQLNGLSVFQVGDYAFGKPTRLTARVSAGKKGIVNVEREARLSGSIHDKGVLILTGYLHGKYGQKDPLSLFASICFEQSYSGVDGDSASSAELFAILSALSGVPLKQTLAVTGSINQMGEIQPIGGVNEKVEGFFETCRASGLTGEQGVIIPHQNVQNLVLRKEVIKAVDKGEFHIYPIETVNDGLEILCGIEAGEPRKDGTYPTGSIHALVQERLNEMALIVSRRKVQPSAS